MPVHVAARQAGCAHRKMGTTLRPEPPMSPKTRILPVAVLLLAAGIARDTAAQASYKSDPPRRAFLFKDARGEVAAARARGYTTVTPVVASMAGQNAQVAALVKKPRGTIGYRE